MNAVLRLASVVVVVSGLARAADPVVTLKLRLDQPGARINPAMWGVFFEDINFAADGGLYAELVKNGSFEFPQAWMGWHHGEQATEAMQIREESPASAAQPHFLRWQGNPAGDVTSASNEGFRGIGVRQRAAYRFSVVARQATGSNTLKLELITADGRVLAETTLDGFTNEWRTRTATLTSNATDAKAHLRLTLSGSGTLDLDRVSLFPVDTWKGRPGGLRADLVQALVDLKPGFVRFPGGCIIEGRDLENRYQWKNTIGDVADRRPIVSRWGTELARNGRGAEDYYQSFGLGFYEYFLLCEDLGAQPLPILNCGMACQFNTGELCPLDQLDPYIQDAFDLIEFANGPATSTWGARRAAMGHPQPFKLTLLGIGNEQWGPQYIERYAKFSEALRARHPEIQLVSGCGPNPAGEGFEFLWSRLRALKADFVDEHYYRPADWFLNNARRYDNYDRSGPKVFAGEYAVHLRNRANSLEAALAEAAAMTGFERNADIVRMASYAPLFAHIDAWQWRPDLIWFDNLRVMATPSYYAQQLFSQNRGDTVVPVELQSDTTLPEKLFASAVRDEATGDWILKVVNASPNAYPASVRIDGARSLDASGKLLVLTSEKPTDDNTLDEPSRVAPKTSTLSGVSTAFAHEFPPHSLSVLRARAQ